MARTPHFVLHRLRLDAPRAPAPEATGSEGSPPQALFCVPGVADAQVWLGAMVPKRWAKRAVTRNAIKRQIYAVSTPLQARLPLAAYVVRLRSTFDRKQFVSASSELLKQAVRSELEQLFARVARPPVPVVTEGAL